MITWPLAIRRVATPVPSTAGMPYSRATIELWLSGPPMSVTTPEASANSGVHAGVVMLATRTSPACIWPKSCGPPSTRAAAVIRPALAPIPVSRSSPCSTVVAGIIELKIRIQFWSGRSCGGVTRRRPRHTSWRSAISAVTRDGGSRPCSTAAPARATSSRLSQ